MWILKLVKIFQRRANIRMLENKSSKVEAHLSSVNLFLQGTKKAFNIGSLCNIRCFKLGVNNHIHLRTWNIYKEKDQFLNAEKQLLEVFCKKRWFKNFAKSLQASVCSACNCIKGETLLVVFSCEFCEIFENAFFIEHLRIAASE